MKSRAFAFAGKVTGVTNAWSTIRTDQRPFLDGPTVRAVDIENVRKEFYASHPAEGTDKQKAAARRQAFNRPIQAAQNSGVIGVRDVGAITFVWLAKPEATA